MSPSLPAWPYFSQRCRIECQVKEGREGGLDLGGWAAVPLCQVTCSALAPSLLCAGAGQGRRCCLRLCLPCIVIVCSVTLSQHLWTRTVSSVVTGPDADKLWTVISSPEYWPVSCLVTLSRATCHPDNCIIGLHLTHVIAAVCTEHSKLFPPTVSSGSSVDQQQAAQRYSAVAHRQRLLTAHCRFSQKLALN